jgi:hypothetical protein
MTEELKEILFICGAIGSAISGIYLLILRYKYFFKLFSFLIILVKFIKRLFFKQQLKIKTLIGEKKRQYNEFRSNKFYEKYNHEYCLIDNVRGFNLKIIKKLSEERVSIYFDDIFLFSSNIRDMEKYLLSFEFSKHNYIEYDIIKMLFISMDFESALSLEKNDEKRKIYEDFCLKFNLDNH